MRCYQDNVLLELDPVETVSAGGIHLVQTCTACSGAGWVRDKQGNKNRCMRCGGGGVAGKQSMGHRLATVLESGPGYHLQKPGKCGSTLETGAFVPNQTKPGMRVVVDALAGNVWDGSISRPRHNQGTDFGERRIVREAEILAILEEVRDVG
jgi:hypothetical protein